MQVQNLFIPFGVFLNIAAQNFKQLPWSFTLSLPDTRTCVNFSTVYNDTLVAKGLKKVISICE